MQTCTICKEQKPQNEFPFKNKGKNIHFKHCKSCQKISRRNSYLAKREHYITLAVEAKAKMRPMKYEKIRLLKSKPCKDCGVQRHYSLMEFDHLPESDKRMKMSQASNFSLKSIEAEANKCEVVCVMCHRVRTWNRSHPNEPISWLGNLEEN